MPAQSYDLFQVFVRKSKSPLFETGLTTYDASNALHYCSEAIASLSIAEVCFRKNDNRMNLVFQFFENAKGNEKIDDGKDDGKN